MAPDGNHVHAGEFTDPATIDRQLAADVVNVRRLVVRFVLAGVVALVVVSIFTAWASQREANQQAIADARRVTLVSAKGIIEPNLTDALLPPTADRTQFERLDRVVRTTMLDGSLVRVKVWATDGTVVYSDEPRLVGRRFELEQDKAEVFTTGDAAAGISALGRPENEFEPEGTLLEVYALVHTEEGTPLLVETYFRYSGVTAVGRSLWSRFAPIALGSLVALEVIQIPFAWSLARRVRAGQLDRERLLRRAIDASDTERRRIASDLHDGVVQDLTGVSLTLSAAQRQGTTAEVAGEAADRVRSSVKALRSLLVEIYPPNLHEEGLRAALGDLASTIANRDIAVHRTLDPSLDAVSPQAASLLYRVAQEALRNVVAHAAAASVTMAGGIERDVAHLQIDDDGRGFAPSTLEARGRQGHLGLRALSGLIADAGGSLTVTSEVGRGTQVRVELPMRVHQGVPAAGPNDSGGTA